jgi:hypothetical protein
MPTLMAWDAHSLGMPPPIAFERATQLSRLVNRHSVTLTPTTKENSNMTLLDQLESMVERSLSEGRQPLQIQIMPTKIAEVEAEAEARQVLGRGTIFGISYEPHFNPKGEGVILTYRDSIPE